MTAIYEDGFVRQEQVDQPALIARPEGLDETLWRIEWDTIWAPHEWPSGTMMSVCYTGATDTFHARLATADYDKVTALIARYAPEANVFVGMSPLRPGTSQGRGKKSDLIGLPAVFADIDIRGPGHKKGNLPDLDTALAIIADLPLRPTLVVHSGGGLYPIFALDELLDPNDDDHSVLLRRWDSLLIATAERHGVGIDKGVAKDPARVMRALGTINRKDGLARPTRLLEHNSAVRYSIVDFDDMLPELSATAARPATVLPFKRAANPSPTTLAEGDDDRPGTRLARALPVAELLCGSLDWLAVGDRLVVPRDDGTVSTDDTHAQVFDNGDGIQRVTVFGARAQEQLGLDGPDHSLSSWDILIRLVGGDLRLAGRIAKRYRGKNDELVSKLRDAVGDLDAMSALAPAPASKSSAQATTVVDLAPHEVSDVPDNEPSSDDGIGFQLARPSRNSAAYAVRGAPVSWRVAMERREGWTPFYVNPAEGEMLFARAGQHTGIWHASQKLVDDGENGPTTRTEYRRISDWVPWREAVVRTRHGVDEVADPEYVVQVLTSAGAVFAVRLGAKDSLHPGTIQEATEAPVALPSSAVGINHVRTALSALGEADRRRDVRYDSTGWVRDPDGKWIMAAPAGSVSAAGIRHDITVVPPEGSEPEQRTGWDRVPLTQEEHHDGLRAINDLFGVTPHRMDWPVAHIGGLFAAPLALPRRTTVVVQAEKGSVKSLAMSAAYAFLSSVGLDGASFPVSIPNASVPGVNGAMVWHRHLMLFVDDYRKGTERGAEKRNAAATDVLGAVTQGAYTGVAEKKKTQAGKLRATAKIECLGCVTAEVLTTEAAFVERCATIIMRKGDVDGSEGGPIDRFRANYAETGIARMGFAGYLQWLAGQLDGSWGTLDAMVREAEQTRRKLYGKYAAARAGEAIAAIATGWKFLYRYAASVGGVHLLPAREKIDAALRDMVAATSEQHRAADPGPIVISALRSMIESGKGHVTAHDGGVPFEVALASGYERRDVPGLGMKHVWQSSHTVLGRYSEDLRYVLLTAAGIEAAQRFAHLDGLDPRQVKDKIAEMCVEGSTPGGRVPSCYGIASRPRGYLVECRLLGLGSSSDIDADDERELTAVTEPETDSAQDEDFDDF